LIMSGENNGRLPYSLVLQKAVERGHLPHARAILHHATDPTTLVLVPNYDGRSAVDISEAHGTTFAHAVLSFSQAQQPIEWPDHEILTVTFEQTAAARLGITIVCAPKQQQQEPEQPTGWRLTEIASSSSDILHKKWEPAALDTAAWEQLSRHRGAVLTILAIGDGLVKDWNSSNTGRSIKANDQIIEANGVCQNEQQLADQLEKDQVLSIKVRRIISLHSRSISIEQLPDHLQYGVTANGFQEILNFYGFWKDGKLLNGLVAKRQERELEFVEKYSPKVSCGYDLQKAIKLEFKQHGLKPFSQCELMVAQSHPGAGWAECFFSHAQMEPLDVTLRAMQQHEVRMRRSLRCFVDYATLRQAVTDFDLPKVESVIQRIGSTAMVCRPALAPDTLKRIFCIFELASTLRHKADLHVVLPPDALQEFLFSSQFSIHATAAALGMVNVEEAESRNPGDKTIILERIRCDLGIAYANRMLSDSIKRSVLGHLIEKSCELCGWSWLLNLGCEIPDNVRALHGLAAAALPQLLEQDAQQLLRVTTPAGHSLMHLAAIAGDEKLAIACMSVAGLDRTQLLRTCAGGRTPVAWADHVALASEAPLRRLGAQRVRSIIN